MARAPHEIVLLLLVACRPPEAETTTTPAAELEARANEVRGRLLAECEAGDVSACRRIGIAPAPEPERADVPAVDGPPVGVVFGSFPGFVGGLPSYGTPLEVADACAQGGGHTLAFHPGVGDIAIACADPRQAATEYRRSWGFIEEVDGQRMVTGRIVTGYYCDVTNPGKRAVMALIYQNALGYMRRVEQLDQRNDSFWPLRIVASTSAWSSGNRFGTLPTPDRPRPSPVHGHASGSSPSQ